MKRTNLYLEDSQVQSLRKIASQVGRPTADLVREAIDTWLVMRSSSAVQPQHWRDNIVDLLEARERNVEKLGLKIDEEKLESDVADEVRALRAKAEGVK